jgi:hypothetical protein
MPIIIRRQRKETRDRIEPCAGHTSQDVLAKLRSGAARFSYSGGIFDQVNPGQERSVTVKDSRDDSIIAKVTGSAGYDSGAQYSLDPGDDLTGALARQFATLLDKKARGG